MADTKLWRRLRSAMAERRSDECVATAAHCFACFEALEHAWGLVHETRPLFVSWYTRGEGDALRLRGCIGTFAPQTLPDGLAAYACRAAMEDSRFAPMEPHELAAQVCSVSFLTPMEPCRDVWDWQLGTHGVYVRFEDAATRSAYTATFLPEVAPKMAWTQRETLEHAVRKAGWRGPITTPFLEALNVWRYRSHQATASYAEYQAQQGKKGGASIA